MCNYSGLCCPLNLPEVVNYRMLGPKWGQNYYSGLKNSSDPFFSLPRFYLRRAKKDSLVLSPSPFSLYNRNHPSVPRISLKEAASYTIHKFILPCRFAGGQSAAGNPRRPVFPSPDENIREPSINVEIFTFSAETPFPPTPRNTQPARIRPEKPLNSRENGMSPLQTCEKRQIPRETPEGKITSVPKIPEKTAVSPLANKEKKISAAKTWRISFLLRKNWGRKRSPNPSIGPMRPPTAQFPPT